MCTTSHKGCGKEAYCRHVYNDQTYGGFSQSSCVLGEALSHGCTKCLRGNSEFVALLTRGHHDLDISKF